MCPRTSPIGRQRPDGTFDLHVLRDALPETDRWLGLAVCRIARRVA